MGNGIAHVFAQSGFKVNLIDISQENLEKAKNTVAKNLDRLIVKEKITEKEKEDTLNNLNLETNLKNAVSNSDLVIEAVTESLDLKGKIFSDLDNFCPENTILASNTSSILITKLASFTQRPEKVIGMHFMNPVPIMKLVEIIRGYSTSESCFKEIFELSKKLHKIPVEVNDYPGFVANRILMPMINEAVYTLHEGVARIEEIDNVMKLGMAHPMGPLQLADFIGLDVCLSILNVLYDGFKLDKYAPCPLLVNMVNANKLGLKTGEGFYDYLESRKAEKVSDRFL